MAKLTAAGAAFTDLVLEVFRVNGLALDAGDRISGPAGLSSARWQVLGVVDHGPSPVADVARFMGLARQSVQQTADALEREGFVEYVENPHHRRAKLIEITAEGRAALRKVEARHAVWANRLGGAGVLRDIQAAVKGLQGARQCLEEDAAGLAASPRARAAGGAKGAGPSRRRAGAPRPRAG